MLSRAPSKTRAGGSRPRVVGSEQVRDAARGAVRVIEVLGGDIVTAAARETAQTLGVRLVDGPLERPAIPATDGAVAASRILYRRSPRWIPPNPAKGLNPTKIPKLAIVGVGGVGMNIAHLAANAEAAKEIVLVDIAPGLAESVALDLTHAAGITRSPAIVRGSSNLSAVRGAQVAVVTAGRPRTLGMNRSDLAEINRKVVRKVGEAIRNSAPEAVVIVVTNPLEEMTLEMLAATGFARERVFGMAGTLDSARFRSALSRKAGVQPADVEAIVLGGHSSDMVPVASSATIKGHSASKLLDESQIAECCEEAISGGGQVVALRKTGSATLAPAHSVMELLDLMRNARAGELPVAALLKGEYGINGAVTGVPCKLGIGGILEIGEISLSPEERERLAASAKN